MGRPARRSEMVRLAGPEEGGVLHAPVTTEPWADVETPCLFLSFIRAPVGRAACWPKRTVMGRGDNLSTERGGAGRSGAAFGSLSFRKFVA